MRLTQWTKDRWFILTRTYGGVDYELIAERYNIFDAIKEFNAYCRANGIRPKERLFRDVFLVSWVIRRTEGLDDTLQEPHLPTPNGLA